MSSRASGKIISLDAGSFFGRSQTSTPGNDPIATAVNENLGKDFRRRMVSKSIFNGDFVLWIIGVPWMKRFTTELQHINFSQMKKLGNRLPIEVATGLSEKSV